MRAAPVDATFSSSTREPLLDLWRGIALVDMAWVHLATYSIGMPHAAAMWIGEYTRFAAGFFVLLAGLTVATVFGSKLRRGGEAARDARRILFRRALVLVAVDRLTCIAFAAIEPIALDPSRATIDEMSGLVRLATFSAPGVTGGLLLLYTVLLLGTPWMERFRQKAGDAGLVATSFALFAAAHFAGPVAHWPPWTFPVAFWQPFYVAGYVAAPRLAAWRSSRTPAGSSRRLLATTALVGGVFLLRSGPSLGISPSWMPELVFVKVPLSAAELGWYLCACAFVMTWTSWLFLRSLSFRRATAWISRMGEWSLLVYVTHLLLELPILALLTSLDPSPLGRASMLLVMVAALGAVARAAERLDAWVHAPYVHRNVFDLLRRRLPPASTTGVSVALASVSFVLMLQSVELRQAGPSALEETVTPEDPVAAVVVEDELALSLIALDDGWSEAPDPELESETEEEELDPPIDPEPVPASERRLPRSRRPSRAASK